MRNVVSLMSKLLQVMSTERPVRAGTIGNNWRKCCGQSLFSLNRSLFHSCGLLLKSLSTHPFLLYSRFQLMSS